MNVFELNSAVAKIKEKAESGELDPSTLADTLESLEDARNEKLDSVANWINEDESKIDWLDKKIKQLTKLKKHYQTQSDNLSKFLKIAIESSGHESIQTSKFNFKFGRLSYRTVVPDVNKIPIDYVTYPDPKPQANKKKIKEDLQKGKDVPGAYLERSRKVVIE